MRQVYLQCVSPVLQQSGHGLPCLCEQPRSSDSLRLPSWRQHISLYTVTSALMHSVASGIQLCGSGWCSSHLASWLLYYVGGLNRGDKKNGGNDTPAPWDMVLTSRRSGACVSNKLSGCLIVRILSEYFPRRARKVNIV
ncbi:hypothetical protein Tco_0446552 [Tanacetum coccineum]